MNKKYDLDFEKSETQIIEPITKFGGQPVWLEEPQWPISSQLNEQMRFICQIALTDDLFPGSAGKVAYIFMTEDFDEYVDDTWEPNGGENAVIIQPGGINSIKTVNKQIGPSREEYKVSLLKGEDQEFIPEFKIFEMSEAESEKYCESLSTNKIGGTPGFMQGDEFPEPINEWLLLLQLYSCSAPFEINFGDSGIAYAFINKNCKEGKFLWQCA